MADIDIPSNDDIQWPIFTDDMTLFLLTHADFDIDYYSIIIIDDDDEY